MDLRQLEYVVEVADSLSFTRAAERCHVVQSALSHQVQRLEAELGTRLFDRTSRRVCVTPAGELFVAYARRILATVTEARTELDALAGLERGQLAVGATQTAGRVIDVIGLFGTFHRHHSGIRLTSLSGPASELVDGVRAGSLDLALVTGGPGPSTDRGARNGVEWQTLVEREPLVAVVGAQHRLAGRSRVRLAQLAESGNFVDFRPGTGLRSAVDAAFADIGVTRPVILELGRISDMVRFASHSLAIAIVPVSFAREPPAAAAPYSTVRLIDDVAVSVSAIRRAGPPGVTLRAFLELLDASLPAAVRDRES